MSGKRDDIFVIGTELLDSGPDAEGPGLDEKRAPQPHAVPPGSAAGSARTWREPGPRRLVRLLLPVGLLAALGAGLSVLLLGGGEGARQSRPPSPPPVQSLRPLVTKPANPLRESSRTARLGGAGKAKPVRELVGTRAPRRPERSAGPSAADRPAGLEALPPPQSPAPPVPEPPSASDPPAAPNPPHVSTSSRPEFSFER